MSAMRFRELLIVAVDRGATDPPPVWKSSFPSVSPSAFLGACSSRNFRQIDIDVL